MKKYFLSLLTILVVFSAFSQEYEELYIVDTSIFNQKTIYVFNDHSWAYAENIKDVEKYLKQSEIEKLLKDTTALFSFNWTQKQSHIKTYNLINLKDSFLINVLPKNHPNNASPVSSSLLKITSTFKIRWNKWHKGIDVGLPIGNTVYSVLDGRVRYAKYNTGGYGNLVIIRHYNGLETYYAHLDKINVKPGQNVTAGQLIGLSGNTGHSTGPHLHFEVRMFGNAFNPFFIWNEKFQVVVNSLYISSGLFYHQRKGSELSSGKVVNQSSEDNKSSSQGTKKTRNRNSTYGTLTSPTHK